MSRIIEIVLFLTPFLSFAAWRLLFPSPQPPLWLVGGLAVFAVLLLLALLWVWQRDAGDAKDPYIPARLQDGRIVPAHRARAP